jgi:hypothetical protein
MKKEKKKKKRLTEKDAPIDKIELVFFYREVEA